MKTEPFAFSIGETRIEPKRRRESDETPLLPPRIPTTRRPEPGPAPRSEVDARKRIEHLEVVLREARLENQRLQLEVSALQRLHPRALAKEASRPPLGMAIAALAAGTLVGLVAGETFVALLAGLGAFSAVVFARWLDGARGNG